MLKAKILLVAISLGVLCTSCTISNRKSLSLDSSDQVSLKSQEHFREHSVNMPSVLKIYSPDRKVVNQVSGLCFIAKDSNSFFDLPCVGVYISLLDEKNQIVFKVKTDQKGRFRFANVDSKKSYHLGVTSESYRTLSEKVYVSTGVDLLLELVEKNNVKK